MCDPTIELKLHQKHKGITMQNVRDALQWPAVAELMWDDDKEHGLRLVANGYDADGREVIAVLIPTPPWDDMADTWVVKTARWVE